MTTDELYAEVTTHDPTPEPGGSARPVGIFIAFGVTVVLLIALVVSLMLLTSWRGQAQLRATELTAAQATLTESQARLVEAESEVEDLEREMQEAVDEAYEEGYAAGEREASLSSESEVNPTARAHMEAAWAEAIQDEDRDMLCLGVELGLVDEHYEEFTEIMPGTTTAQHEAFFREKCGL